MVFGWALLLGFSSPSLSLSSLSEKKAENKIQEVERCVFNLYAFTVDDLTQNKKKIT